MPELPRVSRGSRRASQPPGRPEFVGNLKARSVPVALGELEPAKHAQSECCGQIGHAGQPAPGLVEEGVADLHEGEEPSCPVGLRDPQQVSRLVAEKMTDARRRKARQWADPDEILHALDS